MINYRNIFKTNHVHQFVSLNALLENCLEVTRLESILTSMKIYLLKSVATTVQNESRVLVFSIFMLITNCCMVFQYLYLAANNSLVFPALCHTAKCCVVFQAYTLPVMSIPSFCQNGILCPRRLLTLACLNSI